MSAELNSPRGEWRFRQLARSEKRVDSLSGEFFSDQADLETLVREAIQNCLDAREQEKVTVRVRVSGATETLDRARVDRWLGGLREHLTAAGFAWPEDARMGYLVIEDFGGTGLLGDPASLEETPRNNFYWFWRNEGRSGKGLGKRGSRGVGKWTYPASSKVRAFFGLSNSADNPKPTLLGQAVLKIHEVGGKHFETWGWFASFAEVDGFQLPVASADAVEEFKRDFKITRTGAAGLSIIIPWPTVSLDPRELAIEVIEQYFFPILSRQLLVEVQAPPLPTTRITESTARQLAPSAEKVISLAEWALHIMTVPDQIPPIRFSDARWRTEAIPDEILTAWRTGLASGNRIAARFRVNVRKADGSTEEGEFWVFAEKDETLHAPEDIYIREGITLSGIKRLSTRGVRAILLVRDEPLAGLMRDAEGPAHTHWSATERVKARYRDGARVIVFVRDALKSFAEAASQVEERLDRDLLSEFFSLETAAQPTLSEHDPEVEPPDVDELNRPSQPFRLSSTPEGFTLTGKKATPGQRASVEVAYGVRRGSAFSRWEPSDFDLREPPCSVAVEGGTCLSTGGNSVLVEVTEPRDFRLTVKGLEPYRDLKVRVQADDPES